MVIKRNAAVWYRDGYGDSTDMLYRVGFEFPIPKPKDLHPECEALCHCKPLASPVFVCYGLLTCSYLSLPPFSLTGSLSPSPSSRSVSMGSGGDSFYECLLKQHLLQPASKRHMLGQVRNSKAHAFVPKTEPEPQTPTPHI